MKNNIKVTIITSLVWILIGLSVIVNIQTARSQYEKGYAMGMEKAVKVLNVPAK